MTGATHFIEVWKSKTTGKIVDYVVVPIVGMARHLEDTRLIGCTTIAIWKIKFKTKDNGKCTSSKLV